MSTILDDSNPPFLEYKEVLAFHEPHERMPKDYKLHSKELQQEKEAKKHYFF
jgi:hypothetical protein